MKIQEIIIEQHQLDELDVGQGISKAVGGVARGVGAVAGGIAGIPSAVKKGYRAGKAAVGGTDPEQPATGVAPSGATQFTAPSSNPVTIRSQIRQHQAAISQLQQQLSAPAADDEEDPADSTPSTSNVRPFVRTNQSTGTTPAGTTQPDSATDQTTQDPAAVTQSPEEKRKADWAAATDVARKDLAANPVPTQPATAAPQSPEEKRKADWAAATDVARKDLAANPVQSVAQPDPTAQQANLKARLKTGQGMGTKSGSGFKDYVAGGKGFTAGPNGEPVQKVARESTELYSRFLGRVL